MPSLSAGSLQLREADLVIEKRLIKRAALSYERCLRVCYFNDLRFAGAIASNRRIQIILRFQDPFSCQRDARQGVRDLRARGIKLLGELPCGDLAFVFGYLNLQACLTFAAAAPAPVKDRNVKTEARRYTAVLIQSRRFHRVSLEATIDRI